MLEYTKAGSGFKFHHRCSKLQITHLCFTNDLLIFSEVDKSSISIIQVALWEFESLSGLKANPSKSFMFCSGISLSMKAALLDSLQMKEGKLPFRYLGVPLISSKMFADDCKSLIDKISSQIGSWTSRNLSFARRL